MSEVPLFAHQREAIEKMRDKPGFLNLGEPGVGKTRTHLYDFWERRKAGGGKLLVLAPKSILEAAWGNEINKAFPSLTYVVAAATNRVKAFSLNTDVVLTNIDAAVWIAKNKAVLKGFDTLIIDEIPAYKNPQAQRSKAAREISKHMKYVRGLTGTPVPNSITEIFHQVLLVDKGERLGTSFWKFRTAVCEPFQNGPRPEHVEWRNKPGAEEAVFSLLSDISVRHLLRDCIELPENSVHRIDFELSKGCQIQYDEMRRHAMLLLGEDKQISAVNAASVATKLLQIASGAVYTGAEGEYAILDTARTELVMDLVEARQHTLVSFLWKHQRDQLVAAAKARGLAYAVIDGEVKAEDRTRAVEDFQAGKLRVIFAHPQSAGHGLTLTRGTTTIWTSPSYSSEFFTQFNARIVRAGQKQKTETILVCAKGTIDERVYSMLDKKITGMNLLLTLFEAAA